MSFCSVSLPAASEDISYFDTDHARNFSDIASTIFAPLYGPLAEQIVSEFDLAEKEGVGIDIGGGPGNLVVELCKRTRGMHWINTDINPAFFPYIRKAAEDAGVKNRVSTLFADAQALPFVDAYADIIVSRASFHLWNNKHKSLSEIYRVLKPGGAAFIGRGFSENLHVDLAREIRARQRERGTVPQYDVTQTAEELETIMKSLGIKDYSIRIPKPSGSEGINYGIWVKFYKPNN